MIPRAGDEGPGVSAGWTQGFSLGRRKSSADGVDGCPVRLTPELQGELRTLMSYTVENRRVIHSQFSMYMDPPRAWFSTCRFNPAPVMQCCWDYF